MKKIYNKGDDCWIYLGGKDNPLRKGKILKAVELDGYDYIHYIIEIQTPVDPLLEVRDWHEMSDSEAGPIGMYSQNGLPSIHL